MFAKVVAEQLREKKTEYNKGTVRALHMIVAGEIIRKYRCTAALCNRVGLNKSTMVKYSTRSVTNMNENKPTRKSENKIIDFFERDENSRAQPGKADAKKVNGEVKQTRVLTDYLQQLHRKFLSDNPECAVSFATFCRVRPTNILLCAFISRSSCLCTRHQNMALTLKTLRNEGGCVSANPETFARGDLDEERVLGKLGENIKVPQWKRVQIEDRGKQKFVMRIQDTNMTKQEFITHIQNQKKEFSDHVYRVKTQYNQIQHIKQNLLKNHVVTHMDFAENYYCGSSEEIQSAYFNQTGVTLHPIVVYYMN